MTVGLTFFHKGYIQNSITIGEHFAYKKCRKCSPSLELFGDGELVLSRISVLCSVLEILPLRPLLFFFVFWNIDSFNFEYDRSGSIITTSNHHALVICPAVHNITCLYRSTTIVSRTKSSSPVFLILCSVPFLQIWQVLAVSGSSCPSQMAMLVPEIT